MYQSRSSKRRSWLMRHKFLTTLVAVAVALVAASILRAIPSNGGNTDYRDPSALARAVENSEQAKTPGAKAGGASCGKLPTGKYFCVVAFTDGTSGDYTVTVAPDGHSWTAA
jgi:hypothetical protein